MNYDLQIKNICLAKINGGESSRSRNSLISGLHGAACNNFSHQKNRAYKDTILGLINQKISAYNVTPDEFNKANTYECGGQTRHVINAHDLERLDFTRRIPVANASLNPEPSEAARNYEYERCIDLLEFARTSALIPMDRKGVIESLFSAFSLDVGCQRDEKLSRQIRTRIATEIARRGITFEEWEGANRYDWPGKVKIRRNINDIATIYRESESISIALKDHPSIHSEEIDEDPPEEFEIRTPNYGPIAQWLTAQGVKKPLWPYRYDYRGRIRYCGPRVKALSGNETADSREKIRVGVLALAVGAFITYPYWEFILWHMLMPTFTFLSVLVFSAGFCVGIPMLLERLIRGKW